MTQTQIERLIEDIEKTLQIGKDSIKDKKRVILMLQDTMKVS